MSARAPAPELPLRIALIAGEPSGDRLGAPLMRALSAETGAKARFLGVGGPAMTEAGAAHGFESLFPIADIAVMGFSEVAAKLRTIMARMRQTASAIIEANPDVLITIDAPSFGLRVAKTVREAALKSGRRPPLFVHYVAPSVWAWRPKRAEKMAKHVDHLLALLPFEPPYFERVGLSCDFVGHPVVERAARAPAASAELRAALGSTAGGPLVTVLLGSRRSEVARLAEPFGQALSFLAKKRPGLRVVSPLAETVADLALAKMADWPVPTTPLDPRGLPFEAAENRKFAAYAASDAALAASGTVSLELAATRTPMVIGYRVSAVSAAIARRLLKVDTATLVNLVSETRAVPEFIQERCEPEWIADALDRLLERGGAERAAQAAAAETTMARLGEGDASPSVRAAQSVLAAWARRAAAPADA